MQRVWDAQQGTTHLLAVIMPWRTTGQDAALETVFFKHTLAPIVTDLRNIRGVVGCVESQGQWGIVDRNTALIRVAFAVEANGPLDLDSDTDSDSDL